MRKRRRRGKGVGWGGGCKGGVRPDWKTKEGKRGETLLPLIPHRVTLAGETDTHTPAFSLKHTHTHAVKLTGRGRSMHYRSRK